jgi:hypothetical protein
LSLRELRNADQETEEWANQIAVENGNQYTIQIPSDIKSGTYVLRTELIALHGNMANLNTTSLAGPQFYPYCFNIDIVGNSFATPEGVNIPGIYKPKDYGIAFSPYMTYKETSTAAGTALNSKYVRSLLLSIFSSNSNFIDTTRSPKILRCLQFSHRSRSNHHRNRRLPA